jgi:hypothetical protein
VSIGMPLDICPLRTFTIDMNKETTGNMHLTPALFYNLLALASGDLLTAVLIALPILVGTGAVCGTPGAAVRKLIRGAVSGHMA